MENSQLSLINFNNNRDCILLEEQKKIFNQLAEERSSEFWNLEMLINPDNLIYKYKTEARSPNDFRNYQNLIKLFKNLRDNNKIKSDLCGIKKGSQV